MKFLMIFFFLFNCLLISVSGIGQTKIKTAAPNNPYKKLDNGEVVEIKEDSGIVENSTPIKLSPVNKMPLIEFDTSLIPQDIFTRHINELIKEMDILKLSKNVTNKLIDNAKNKDPDNQELQNFYKRFWVKINNPLFDSLFTNLYIRKYRKYFTDDDVKELLVFYKSPVGKKSLQLLPAITSNAMAEGEKLGKYFGSMVVYEMEAEKQNK